MVSVTNLFILSGPQPGFFEKNDPIETSVRISDDGYERIQEDELGLMAYSLVMAVLVLFVTVVCVFCREEMDGTVSVFCSTFFSK